MSLWFESFSSAYDNCTCDEERKKCVLCYLSMPVPRIWWENCLKENGDINSYAKLIKDVCKEFNKTNYLDETDYSLFVALAYIDEQMDEGHQEFGIIQNKYSVRDYFKCAAEVLLEKPELRKLGKMIAQPNKGNQNMENFGDLKKVPLCELWPNEATVFTPWLASNVEALGSALGMELELIEREASVGDFSLDLLAKDLGSSRTVIIENQLTQTDHDHLGKLLTYAAGFSASIVIWVSESIRDEHRQALEWLNQRTDTETQFFGVVIEVLKIDESRPAYNFKPVVYPNEWQKSKKQKTSPNVSSKGEKYRAYFQSLIDELREKHRFTGAKAGQPQSWYSFSSGIKGVYYGANFALGGKARTEIYIDQGDTENNKKLFDFLKDQASEIENEYGSTFEWERLDDKRACRIALYTDAVIDSFDSELEQLRNWHIENLLLMKKVFLPKLQQYNGTSPN